MAESTSAPAADKPDFISLAADIVAAYVANNSVPVAELPALLSGVHVALAGLSGTSVSAESQAEKPTSAQIKRSIKPDALISFIDGKPYKTLKRHLSGHGLTFEEYRARYGLPADYPSVAASYSAMRADFARSLGLGTQRRRVAPKTAAVAETVTEAPKARGPKKTAEPAPKLAEKPTRARKPRKTTAVE